MFTAFRVNKHNHHHHHHQHSGGKTGSPHEVWAVSGDRPTWQTLAPARCVCGPPSPCSGAPRPGTRGWSSPPPRRKVPGHAGKQSKHIEEMQVTKQIRYAINVFYYYPWQYMLFFTSGM
jgi:hypothetical protein